MKHPFSIKDRLIIDLVDELIDNLFITDDLGQYQQSISIEWQARERLYDRFKSLLEFKE